MCARKQAAAYVFPPCLPASATVVGLLLDQLQELALAGVELHSEQPAVLARLEEPDRSYSSSPLPP